MEGRRYSFSKKLLYRKLHLTSSQIELLVIPVLVIGKDVPVISKDYEIERKAVYRNSTKAIYIFSGNLFIYNMETRALQTLVS